MLVYQACVLSTLLYGSETWTTYAKQERRLNSFHQRCLRKILRIRWSDKVSNEEVLQRTNQTSIQSMLGIRRLRWLGHVDRMGEHRIPKQVLYGELKYGQRKRGAQYKRYKDLCQSTLKDYQIDLQSWRTLASDRSKWRSEVRKGAKLQQQQKSHQKAEKKLRAPLPNTQCWPCNHCGRICKSQIGLHSHLRKCSRTAASSQAT